MNDFNAKKERKKNYNEGVTFKLTFKEKQQNYNEQHEKNDYRFIDYLLSTNRLKMSFALD